MRGRAAPRRLDEDYWKMGPLQPLEWLVVLVIVGILAGLIAAGLSHA